MKKSVKAGIALAIVGSLASATPAFAAVFSGDDIVVGPDNNEWRWDSASDLSLDGPYNDVWGSSGDSDTWDSTGNILYGSDDSTNAVLLCNDPADLSAASDSSGDQILTCAPQLVDNGDGEVSVQSEFRFYADGQTWRQRTMVTNNGVAAVDGQVLHVNYNSYQDGDTAIAYTSTAGTIGDWSTDYGSVSADATTPADLIWVTDNRTDSNSAPVVKYAVGRAGSSVLPADDATRGWVSGGHGNGSDDTNSYYELPSLAAGETVEIVTLSKVYVYDNSITPVAPMNSWETATHNAVLLAIADTALESDAVVFAGITDTTKVLNWTSADAVEPTPTPTPTPTSTPEVTATPAATATLAATGTNSAVTTGLGALSLALLISGAVALGVIRRRASV
jgi:hypothetical protein